MIECGLCRSGRSRRPAGLEVEGDFGLRQSEMTGSCGGGKTVPLSHQEPIGGDAERRMVVKAAPAAPFVVSQSQFLLEFLVVALNDPALFGQSD